MKRACLFLALSTFVLAATAEARNVTVERTFDEIVAFESGEELILENRNGAIEVSTWDRDEVRVWARIEAKGRDRADAEELLDEIEVRIERSSGRLEVYFDHPRNDWGWGRGVSISYELTVPEEVDLDLKTVNGDVDVGAIDGEVVARTTNGSVDIDRVHGSVSAKTTNGGIEVVLASYDGHNDLEFTTTNGSINVRLPEDIKGSFEAHSTNGHIETDFPITVRGKISRKSIKGELNGGGNAMIKLKTTNGSIFIREGY